MLVNPPSDFSYDLKVPYKAVLISYEAASVIIMPSHGQSWPVQFPLCEFSILHKSCVYCLQSHGQISQRHEVSQSITRCWHPSEFNFPAT
jgi:hypothetical protein